MTTLSCLVAWLFIYLFAVSSLSLCSINGNVGEASQDGLAIGQSKQTHAQKNHVSALELHMSNSEGRKREREEGVIEDQAQQNSAKEQDPGLFPSEIIDQDGKHAGPLPYEEPSPKTLKEDHIFSDSVKDAVKEGNDGLLESDEGTERSPIDEDIIREKDPSLSDGEPSHDIDPTPVNIDTERSSEVKLHQHDTSGPDNESNTKDAVDDLQQQTHVVQEEAEEHNNIALDSDKMDKNETSSLDLDADPDPNQASKPEEESIDAMIELDQDELDDIKTELVNKISEEEVTNASADVSELNSELHSDDEKLEDTSKGEEKDILKEQLSTEALGEKGDIKTTEDGEDKGKETSTVDQQIDIVDEKVKRKDEEKHKTQRKGDEKEKEKETEGEKVEGAKETKEEIVEKEEKERETKDEEDERIKQDQEEKKDVEAKPKVESDDEEVKPKEDGTEEETKSNVTDTVVIKTEEMPSYDEWREKKLQQAQEDFDRELGQGERNPVPSPKFNLNENSKNHASADCGSKILGTNPDAQSASAILNSNRDIYMINPCSAKSIWFIVELCEPIQVKLIELANYELFSCVPESFRVSISDRYPVREWHQLGIFVARDERSLQNFPLNEETMFAKYMKIEMLTFFGSEHFCPLSVLRVFGTSMVEEIDDAEGVNSGTPTEQDVLPVHPTPLAEDLKGNGILENAKDAIFKLAEKAAKVLTGSKSDTDAYTDNMTDGATDEILMERSLPDDITKDDTQDPDNENFNETHNDKCNGQDVCFQENYSTMSQHCCLSLFAQTAGSILICCKALRRGPKPIKPEEETVEETSNLLLPSQLPMEVIQTKIENTQAKIEGSIRTSIVLEPTPPEMYHGEDEKIETSSPPVLILSTKTPTGATKPSETPQSDILATRTKTEEILHTPIEQTKKVVDDVSGQTDSTHEEGKESESDIIVKPIPAPPTVDSLKEESTKEKSSSIDGHDVEPSATEPSKSNINKEDLAPPIQTLKRSEREENEQPTGQTSEKDTAKANAAQDVTSSSQNVSESEINGNVSEQLTDKDPQSTADTKEQNGANKNVSNKLQEPKLEMNESTKVSPSSTLGEKSTTVTNNSKSATPDVGNGSFSPSASSLSGLGPLPHGTQKESVLMRLNNRIKTLEINMSLSGLYLEELSQRYRKQMDEMQKAFNTKIKSVQENAQKAQEVRQQQTEYIQQLQKSLEKLTTDHENVTLRMDGILREVVERHLFLMLCEVVVMVILLTYCLRRSASQSSLTINSPVGMATKSSGKKPIESVGRRNSDGLIHVPMRNKITLSPGLGTEFGFMKDIANSKTGSLDDLLIIGPTTPLREALRQASEPSKQKNRNKSKGRHKNIQRPSSAASATSNENVYQGAASSSSSNSSIASTLSLSSISSNKGLSGATSSKHSTAGLLFRGSVEVKKGSQGGQTKQGVGGKGGSRQTQRGAPENVGPVNGVHQGDKNNGVGVNGYSGAASGGGSKKNNPCFNGYGKR
ncbi:SUN domain-containing ossification factor isoform X1 [Strongylocentrotus purpuratus]|uniref:SUN domain-containing protein n=1 Tax=Strongylocentrotus purpuratus TaxID=7668 RepID=A0A7M7G110_STRPU|nr:SUN domain-containing ossification factor isoform X1 [Strongylocentrotus purpuratus]